MIMENIKLFQITLFGIFCATVFGNRCLINLGIEPCTYHMHDRRIHMICEDISNISTLMTTLNKIKGCKIFMLQFVRLQLDSLPRGVFNGTKINSLVFTNSSLTSLAKDEPGPSPFLGLEDVLHTFGISGSETSLQKWNWSELSRLHSLETLSFARSNKLITIPNSFSQINSTSLRRLSVTASCLNRIDDFAFANFNELETINLEVNKLDLIRRNMFPSRPKKLKQILLRYNRLRILDGDTFENMPALRILDLEGNSFSIIQENVFYRIWDQLSYLSFYKNEIVCDCKILWIIGKKIIYEKDNEYLKCNGPPHLNGTLIRYLQKNTVCTE